jgi:hypothetical protein
MAPVSCCLAMAPVSCCLAMAPVSCCLAMAPVSCCLAMVTLYALLLQFRSKFVQTAIRRATMLERYLMLVSRWAIRLEHISVGVLIIVTYPNFRDHLYLNFHCHLVLGHRRSGLARLEQCPTWAIYFTEIVNFIYVCCLFDTNDCTRCNVLPESYEYII